MDQKPGNSQSFVSHESGMSQLLVISAGATIGHPLVMRGHFFQQNFRVTIR
jgi:hypothetical protein